MIERLKERRDVLQLELELSTRRLAELEQSMRTLKDTMARIAGAIQVIDELIAETEAHPENPPEENKDK
ncbi:hypothetical protein [Azospirillum formosense]|uniref:hypothetical protein n=1 Tax=Azospirillum formosense TaxID=861533 RepID=UPI00338F89B2